MTASDSDTAPADAVTAAARRLEGAPADAVVRWARERFGDGLVLAASLQDSVLIDVVAGVDPVIEVVFLDTGYHFPETLRYLADVQRRYGLRLIVVHPEMGRDDRWRRDVDGCCHDRKVAPLDRALRGRGAWMSGVRRAEAPSRSGTSVVAWDARRGLVKVNPLATWSDADVERYERERDLLVHPLRALGYRSIGCWPCTRPVTDGEDARAGRWSGSGKTECGLHA